MSTHPMSSSSPILQLIPRQESIPFNTPVTDDMKQLESSFVHHHENDEPVKPSPTVTELNVTTDRMIDEAFQLEPETLKSEPTVDFISSSTLDGEGALQSLVSAGQQVERQLESREVKIERQKALRVELARAKKALFYDKIIFAQKMEQLDQIKACREEKEQMAKKLLSVTRAASQRAAVISDQRWEMTDRLIQAVRQKTILTQDRCQAMRLLYQRLKQAKENPEQAKQTPTSSQEETRSKKVATLMNIMKRIVALQAENHKMINVIREAEAYEVACRNEMDEMREILRINDEERKIVLKKLFEHHLPLYIRWQRTHWTSPCLRCGTKPPESREEEWERIEQFLAKFLESVDEEEYAEEFEKFVEWYNQELELSQ